MAAVTLRLSRAGSHLAAARALLGPKRRNFIDPSRRLCPSNGLSAVSAPLGHERPATAENPASQTTAFGQTRPDYGQTSGSVSDAIAARTARWQHGTRLTPKRRGGVLRREGQTMQDDLAQEPTVDQVSTIELSST